MAMKPKKMRGGGMAGKKTVGMAGKKVPTMVTKAPVGAPGTKTPSVTGPKRAPTGRSGPNTAKVAMGKKAGAVKKAGARRAGGMPVGMSKGGKVGRKKK